MRAITAARQARIGVSIIGIENDTAVEINAGKYPMESGFTHIALAVLHEVDRGNLSMDQMIVITKDELSEKTWSPIKDRYPNGTKLPLSEVLKATVGQSDNIGCDVLLKPHRRPRKVTGYIRSLGIKDTAIAVTERQMHEVGYAVSELDNAASSSAAGKKFTLKKSFRKELRVSAVSFVRHKNRSKTSSCRPACRNALAHKTGTSAVINGITGGVNDIGIVTLPDGRHYAISVFADSRESMETNEKSSLISLKRHGLFLRLRSERTGKRSSRIRNRGQQNRRDHILRHTAHTIHLQPRSVKNA